MHDLMGLLRTWANTGEELDAMKRKSRCKRTLFLGATAGVIGPSGLLPVKRNRENEWALPRAILRLPHRHRATLAPERTHSLIETG